MNKLTKGTVAAAAAIALLLGGAGTFANWNATSAVAGGNITAGSLSLDGAGAGTWSDTAGTINLASDRIMPGDVLTFTQDFKVTAVGHSLLATLSLTGGSIAAASTDAADVALAVALGNSATLTATGLAADGNGGYVVPAGTTSVSVTVTIAFPEYADNGSQNGRVSLSGMNVTLTQK
jgi:alternate signal-mediated exported protein